MDDSGNNCCYQKLEVAEKSFHVFTMPTLPSITSTDGYIKIVSFIPTIYFRQVTYLQKYSNIFKHTFIFISSFSEVTSEIVSFYFNIFLYPNSFSSFGNLVCQNLFTSSFLLVSISITIGRCSQWQINNLLSFLNLLFGL